MGIKLLKAERHPKSPSRCSLSFQRSDAHVYVRLSPPSFPAFLQQKYCLMRPEPGLARTYEKHSKVFLTAYRSFTVPIYR